MHHRFRNQFVIIGIACAVAAAGTSAYAQMTPEPSPSPAVTAAPESTPIPAPMPATTPMPEMSPMPVTAPVSPQQGGTTTNSNGPNWLDKFNRKPGPDLNAMPAKRAMPAMKKTIKMKPKKATHPPG